MSEQWGQWAVGLGDNAVFLVQVEDGLEVGKDEGVELDLCRSCSQLSPDD